MAVSIDEIAEVVGKPARTVVQKAKDLGYTLKTTDRVGPDLAEILSNYILTGVKPENLPKKEEKPKIVFPNKIDEMYPDVDCDFKELYKAGTRKKKNKIFENLFGKIDLSKNKAFIFRSFKNMSYLHEIKNFDSVHENDLVGLENELSVLDSNTKAFLDSKGGLNALLWGARGCGKSSVVKCILTKYIKKDSRLRVIEIDSKDIDILPIMFDFLESFPYKFIIFCDDLAFSTNDGSYHSLKSALQGSLQKNSKNALIYTTTNIRHILKEDSNELDMEHENLSLYDRFPLSIGFYNIGLDEYLKIIQHFISKNIESNSQKLDLVMQKIRQDSINFAAQAGNRNPRTAISFLEVYKDSIQKAIDSVI